jgi:hypothetical protein
LNLGTDIWLGILPYRALVKIRERRLRAAVCGVYSLACVIIIVSVLRLVLLVKDAAPNIKAVIVLSSIEGSVSIIVATIPGISSAFLQKYGLGDSGRRRGHSNSNYRKAHSHFNNAHM